MKVSRRWMEKGVMEISAGGQSVGKMNDGRVANG